MATKFNQRLEVALPESDKNAGWRFLLREVRSDGSHLISFEELTVLARKQARAAARASISQGNAPRRALLSRSLPCRPRDERRARAASSAQDAQGRRA